MKFDINIMKDQIIKKYNKSIENNKFSKYVTNKNQLFHTFLQLYSFSQQNQIHQLLNIIIYQVVFMKRRFSKEEQDEDQFRSRKVLPENQWNDVPVVKGVVHKKRKEEQLQQYKCGNATCNKFYHSYTAFYNHCKKSHEGQFPQNSLINGKIFEGPSKNRGRPRITKIDTKNMKEIQAMKSQNQLIEFLGTINPQKFQQVIVYIEDPVLHIEKSLEIVQAWKPKENDYLKKISEFNKKISNYDLPQFYDPIESDSFPDLVDTYSFQSIVKFLQKVENRTKCGIDQLNLDVIRLVTIVWLGRVVSINLLAQIIWIFIQVREGQKEIQEKNIFENKSKRFIEISDRFFKSYCNVNENVKIEN